MKRAVFLPGFLAGCLALLRRHAGKPRQGALIPGREPAWLRLPKTPPPPGRAAAAPFISLHFHPVLSLREWTEKLIIRRETIRGLAEKAPASSIPDLREKSGRVSAAAIHLAVPAPVARGTTVTPAAFGPREILRIPPGEPASIRSAHPPRFSDASRQAHGRPAEPYPPAVGGNRAAVPKEASVLPRNFLRAAPVGMPLRVPTPGPTPSIGPVSFAPSPATGLTGNRPALPGTPDRMGRSPGRSETLPPARVPLPAPYSAGAGTRVSGPWQPGQPARMPVAAPLPASAEIAGPERGVRPMPGRLAPPPPLPLPAMPGPMPGRLPASKPALAYLRSEEKTVNLIRVEETLRREVEEKVERKVTERVESAVARELDPNSAYARNLAQRLYAGLVEELVLEKERLGWE